MLWVQQARRDHFDFVTKMEDRGVEVLELGALLADVVADKAGRDWVLDRKITDEQVGAGVSQEVRPWLDEMAAADLAEYLIGGIPFHEVPKEVAGPFTVAFGEMSPTGFVTKPLPNTQFTRDNSAWIFNGVSLNPMFWPARRQETLLVAAVYRFHPAFSGGDYEVWLGDPDGEPHDYGAMTLEGGDVMPIGKAPCSSAWESGRHGRRSSGRAEPLQCRGGRAGHHRRTAQESGGDASGHRLHVLRPARYSPPMPP